MTDDVEDVFTPANLPEGHLFIVLSPGTIETGFQAAIYNRIVPANLELLCLARGMVELLASSTEGVLMVGQNALNAENTIEGEATDVTELEVTKDTDLAKVEPAGSA